MSPTRSRRDTPPFEPFPVEQRKSSLRRQSFAHLPSQISSYRFRGIEIEPNPISTDTSSREGCCMSATLPVFENAAAKNAAEAEILTPEAMEFLGCLSRRFESRRIDLLRERDQRQSQFDAGKMPKFPAETRDIREAEWRVAPIPPCLLDRRVEITGPVERKMVINALNSGANVFMADFEDSNAPTWSNCLEGQRNLRDAVHGSIRFTGEGAKTYALNDKVATLFVRPRGWHLIEKHITVDGAPA